MKAKATIYDLGRGVGVCHFRRDNLTYVAEVNMDGLRVLPQSVREVRGITHEIVVVGDAPTDQDHVDRMALAITRLRGRLAEFDPSLMARASPIELQAQARALVDEAARLTGGA
jgi:hypothetical protein